MHRSLAACAIVAALLLAATRTRAGEIEIEFDLTGSSLSALGGLINVPPDGAITSGTARIRVPGAGAMTASAGPARLSDFALGLDVNADTGGAVVTGSAAMAQNGVASGTFTGMFTHLALTKPFPMLATGSFPCSGAGCTALGSFPLTFNGAQTIAPPVNFTLGKIGTPGQATAKGTLLMKLGTHTAVLAVAGSEVSRTYLPEPGWPWHAALVVASLLVFTRLRRS
ncbi:MAG: hypothetical protein OEW02_04805 [Myxococcales bacterium]|nr:hypothetical protein [Myxococcales bacterium]MDH5566920.1 hypothetical protein [Myxococcales bacterium]